MKRRLPLVHLTKATLRRKRLTDAWTNLETCRLTSKAPFLQADSVLFAVADYSTKVDGEIEFPGRELPDRNGFRVGSFIREDSPQVVCWIV